MSNDLKRRIISIGRISSILILSTIISSCNGQKKMASDKDVSNEEKMILVDQNNYSGVDSTETMIITNAKALKAFYAQVNRTRKPGLPVPEIDFSKNMVVIHCSSDENFEGTEKLSVLNESDTEIVLGMDTIKRDGSTTSNSGTNQVSPFFVYKMPLTDKKVSFEPLQ